MAAIGRFQKGDEIFFAKVVDGELFRLQGDVFGSPSFEKKPVPLKGVKTLTPVVPSKIIAVGLKSFLVLTLVNQLIFTDPGHHGSQLGTHCFDRMLGVKPTARSHLRVVGTTFQDELFGIFTSLDILQTVTHGLLGVICNNLRTGYILAIFRII